MCLFECLKLGIFRRRNHNGNGFAIAVNTNRIVLRIDKHLAELPFSVTGIEYFYGAPVLIRIIMLIRY